MGLPTGCDSKYAVVGAGGGAAEARGTILHLTFTAAATAAAATTTKLEVVAEEQRRHESVSERLYLL